MKRKALAVLLSLSLLLSFSACGAPKKEEPAIEQGGFNPVTVSEKTEKDYSEKNTFTQLDEPFGFEYKEICLPRSHQRFMVPNIMSVSVITARHLKMTMTGGDAFGSKDIDFHLHLKTPVQDQGVFTGYTPPSTISSSLKTFNNELIYTSFAIGNDNYRFDTVPDISARMLPSISNGDNACYFEFEDPSLLGDKNSSTLAGYSALVFAYTFDGVDAIWYSVFPKESLENVKKLLTYIVSTVKYEMFEDRPFSSVSLNNFDFCVPPDAVLKTYGTSSFYQVPYLKSLSSYAGFGVGVFDYSACEKARFNNIYLMFTGVDSDEGSSVYRYGHEDNVDLNGNMAEFCDTYYANVRNPNGDSFFLQGSQVIFKVYKFGSQAFIVFDKDDMFTYHFDEFKAKCLNSNFKHSN